MPAVFLYINYSRCLKEAKQYNLSQNTSTKRSRLHDNSSKSKESVISNKKLMNKLRDDEKMFIFKQQEVIENRIK